MYPSKVLLIEDDENDYQRIVEGIDRTKFEIMVETYSHKAVERLRADEKFGAIKAVLLDAVELNDPSTNLPQSIQGEELALLIRQIKPELPIFAVSWFRDKGIRVRVDGVYPKATLFSSHGTFHDLEEAMSDAIEKAELVAYYPEDRGGSNWQKKWGQEYIRFKGDSTFELNETQIGQRARLDYNLLADGDIHGTYRKYRGPDSLNHVLIIRRVIFASVFSNYVVGRGVVWKDVCEFLGFDFPADEVTSADQLHGNLRNLMNECGIKWGNIINRGTLLKEEEEWLRRESFLRE